MEIKRIDIENFGCYKNYKQHDQKGVGNDFNEGKVNIFYGRNYSGKSTYSKIFQSIELRKLPEKYDDIHFEIKLASQTIIKSKEIESSSIPIDCRVFNQQFVDNNISLHNDNKINSFQISIGSDTNETLKEIEEIRLNELDPRRENLSKIESSLETEQNKFKIADNNLTSKLKKIASSVKNRKNPSVITGKKYDIQDIRRELQEYSSYFPIIPSQDDKESLIELENKVEQAKIRILENNIGRPKQITLLTDDSFDFNSCLAKTKNLLSKVITISNILDEYKNHSDEMNWIKRGVDIHGENPEKCIFCGNSIDSNLIKNLKLAFSDELIFLEKELEYQKTSIELEIQKLGSTPNINKDDYFKDSTIFIENINKEINNIIDSRTNILEKIKLKIIDKQRDIFSKIEIDDLIWDSFSKVQDDIDSLYKNTVEQIEQFENRKLKSVNFLRRYYIAKELSVSEFNKLSEQVKQIGNNIDEEKENKDNVETEIKTYETKISKLESSLKSESEAVNRINIILQNSLAHSELSLKSIDNEEKIYFEVSRNEERAYNLSEGEKSLIAFAYYIARLESLSVEEKSKTILFIDDPISSLDENNIFYIYNLIFCLFEKKEFLQYFLSTHNLDFLKYTNRFSAGKDYYLIEKIKEAEDKPSKSYIKKLPKHLSSKVTEFVFLFEQIYKVATVNESEHNFSFFYNFPNNGRKFIEILLYFKYPDYKKNNDDKIKNYFGEDNAPFIQRINNEYSHGEDRFDRTRNPVNTSEFKHDAIIILKTLYKNDTEQFEAFLSNSNLPQPSFLQGD